MEEILAQVDARIKAINLCEVDYPSHRDTTEETMKQLHQARIELSASSIYPQLFYTSHWHHICIKKGIKGSQTIRLALT